MPTFLTRFTPAVRAAGLLLLLTAWFASGCSSLDKPASAGFAGVLISNYSIEQIAAAATTVFANDGYQTIRTPDGGLRFEKEATRGDQIAYAGLAGAHEGVNTIVRVIMGIEPQGTISYMVSCKAYVVTSPGDSFNESSYPLFGFQSGPYQKLLERVKYTVQHPPATP